jgi:hypothetical protein
MRPTFSSPGEIQDMLNRASNNSVLDFGMTVLQKPLTMTGKTGITLKGTLIGGVPTHEWTPISGSDPLYSRFPSLTRHSIWVTTAPMPGPNPFGSVDAIQWGDAVVRNTPKFPTLIWDNEAMTLARSPGYETGGAASPSTTTLIYDGVRPDSYASTTGLAVVGYFTHPWAPEMRTVSGINTGTKTLTCSATTFTSTRMANPRFFYTNIPEELDEQGEYYIDRSGLGVYGRVYFIPPGLVDPNTKPSYISSISTAPLLTVSSCNELISEVNLIGSRHGALWVSTSNDVLVQNCKISGIGSTAVNLSGGNLGISGVNITSCQDISMYVQSGNRYDFTPANLTTIDNCDFNNTSILGVHNTSTLTLAGAGYEVTNCSFNESPGGSIRLAGNDVLIDACTFTDVLKADRDNGVIYWGRNPTFAGIEIRNCTLNYNNLLTPMQDDAERDGKFATGIYADDGAGNALISDCTFNTDDRGIYMNGGRNVTVVNPVFNDCHYPWYLYGALTTPNIFGYYRGTLAQTASQFVQITCTAEITPTGTPQNMSVAPLTDDVAVDSPIFFNYSNVGMRVAATASAGATSISVVDYLGTGFKVLAGQTITCTSTFNSTSTPAAMSVSALSANVLIGQHIYFAPGKYVVATATATTGQTSITVRNGPSDIPVNQTINNGESGTTVDIGVTGSVLNVVCTSDFTSTTSPTSMSVSALERALTAQTEIYFPLEDRLVILESNAAAGATSISVRAGVDGGGLISASSNGYSGGEWQLTSKFHSSQIEEVTYFAKYPEIEVYLSGSTLDEYRIPEGCSIDNPTYNNCKYSEVTLDSVYGATVTEI